MLLFEKAYREKGQENEIDSEKLTEDCFFFRD